MAWVQLLSFLCTNGLRSFLGLYLVAALLACNGSRKAAAVLSVGAAVLVTALSCLHVSRFCMIAVEVLLLLLAVNRLLGARPRMSLFILVFYEMAVALWEFIVSAGLGIWFHSESCPDIKAPGGMAAVWIVRLLMVAVALGAGRGSMTGDRLMAGVAVAGVLGVVLLSGQRALIIDSDQMTTWIVFSTVILMAVLFYKLSCQYEMERTIARLEAEKSALLERDYRTLSNTYAVNAKLFHDFHNHVDVLYGYLAKGRAKEAAEYLENLRSPMRGIAQTVWTGDEAVDYLINSKIAQAASGKIRMEVNIEFPRHTNIRSVHLAAILGNLLDNALEASGEVGEELRFIRLTIRRIQEMLVIKVENGCAGPPVLDGGELRTSKADRTMHGWGLKSVRTAAEYYDGTVDTSYADHRFRTVVTLYFEAVRI